MYLTNRANSRYLVFDIEANGLVPDTLWCMCVKELGSEQIIDLVGRAAMAEYINQQPVGTVWVGHNALSYDMPVLNRLAGTGLSPLDIVDTLVLSTLYNPRMPDGHSLRAYGERFGDAKIIHEDWTQFSQDMLLRCRQDVRLTEKVLTAIRAKMLKIGFSELSCELEHGIRHVVNQQEKKGFYMNAPLAQQFYAGLVVKMAEYEAEVLKAFPPELEVVMKYRYRTLKDGTDTHHYSRHKALYPLVDVHGDEYWCWNWVPLNLGSPKQRVKRLTALGYVPVNMTKGGQPQVDEDGINAFLEECEEDVKPAVRAMANWLVVNARVKMIGGWLDALDPKDQAIHGKIFTCGALSRRCTHSEPNTANIPSNEATYGPECRRVWTARPGRVLVGGDAKAVQMRMFAHYLGNVEVGMEYVNGDPHQRNADAANIPRKKVKNCFYAMIFGAQDPRLGTTGIGGKGTKKDGARIRKALYASTPGLEDLFAVALGAYNAGDGWLECIDGGYVRCPSPHAALNYWIQSGEAILMKWTAIKVFWKIKETGLDAHQVGFIHDELQWDCHPRDAQKVGEIFLEAIAEAGKQLGFIIPMEGSFAIGRTWEETH